MMQINITLTPEEKHEIAKLMAEELRRPLADALFLALRATLPGGGVPSAAPSTFQTSNGFSQPTQQPQQPPPQQQPPATHGAVFACSVCGGTEFNDKGGGKVFCAKFQCKGKPVRV
jgi:hypothetical protein